MKEFREGDILTFVGLGSTPELVHGVQYKVFKTGVIQSANFFKESSLAIFALRNEKFPNLKPRPISCSSLDPRDFTDLKIETLEEMIK